MLDSNNRQFSGILPSAPPEPALLPPAPEPAPQKCQASGASEPCLCRWWQFRASVAFSVLRGLYFTELSTYLTYEQGPCIGLLVYILPATKPAIMTNLAYPRAGKICGTHMQSALQARGGAGRQKRQRCGRETRINLRSMKKMLSLSL